MSRETNSERVLDTIVVGIRHRKELGDIDELAHSMSQIGLLQPITITPDGVLVCGRRRLEAARQLGWHAIKVWVRSGISDRLTELLAQQDENSLHKPLTITEQAALYAELKELYAEEARRKKQATQFGPGGVAPGVGPLGEVSGSGDSPEPSANARESRSQAALTVTGKSAYHRLDHVRFLQMVAKDPFQPSTVRDLASTELAAIVDDGAAVEPAYRKVQAAIELAAHPAPETESAEAFNAEVTQRARQKNARRGLHSAPSMPVGAASAARTYRSVRSFLLTWNELDGWSSHYDVDQLARDLSEVEYARFDRIINESVTFRDHLRAARERSASVTS